tara:strand:+ start:85 stop:900 length:816 start_codon:yes stop_codon:yes gene_type:complete
MESIKNTFSTINPFSKTKTPMENITDDVSERLGNVSEGLSNVKNTVSSTIEDMTGKSNTQKIMDRFSLTPPTVEQIKQSVTPIKTSSTFSWGTRLIFLFIILALLATNSYKYLAKGEHGFLKNLVDTFLIVLDTIKDFFENTFKGTKMGSHIIFTSIKDFINLLKSLLLSIKSNEDIYIKSPKEKIKKKLTPKNQVDNNKVGKSVNKNKKNNNKPMNDSSNSKIQMKEGGYCYIGFQTPHNACIKVNDIDKCMSGKVFKTKARCDEYIPNI